MFFELLSQETLGEESGTSSATSMSISASSSSGFVEKKKKRSRGGFFEALTVCEELQTGEGRIYVEMLPTWKFGKSACEISACVICSTNFRKGDVVRCLPCLVC